MTKEHEGQYSCWAYNEAGGTYASAYLHVTNSGSMEDGADSEDADVQTTAGSFNSTELRTKPKFTRMDKMYRVMAKPAGNMVKLKCQASGNPTPNITWTKNGKVPERQLGIIQYRQWSIMLEDVVTSDSGNYTCHVCNSEGCIEYTYLVDIIGKFGLSIFVIVLKAKRVADVLEFKGI